MQEDYKFGVDDIAVSDQIGNSDYDKNSLNPENKRNEDKQNTDLNTIPTENKRYACGICNKGFVSTWTLRKHSALHTGSYSKDFVDGCKFLSHLHWKFKIAIDLKHICIYDFK